MPSAKKLQLSACMPMLIRCFFSLTEPGAPPPCRFVKDADKAIIGKLREAGRIINVAVERHSYPFCWRSETPLIYRVHYKTFVGA